MVIEQGPEVICEYLNKVLEGTSFEEFEATQHGELTRSGIRFCMRVGLHFNRPVQAIMALGYFVKMRKYENSDDAKDLYELNPKQPMLNMYRMDDAPEWVKDRR